MTATDAPLVLNGSARPHTEMSVLELVRQETGLPLGSDGRTATGTACGVAAAVNGDIVPRSAWARIALRPGDRIELLTAVQGG